MAWRNLVGQRRRWLVSTGAVAVAAALVLFTQGLLQWIETSTTAYLEHLPATVVATEPGVRDFLYSFGTVPPTSATALGAIPGVARAVPLLAFPGVLQGVAHPLPITVVGSPIGAIGGPWALSAGSRVDGPDQAVVDRGLAVDNGFGIGSKVTVLGKPLRIVGLARDANAAGNFFVFVSLPTAQAIVGAPVVSEVALTLHRGASSARVRSAADKLPGIHALRTSSLAKNDLSMIESGVGQPVRIVVLVTLLIGLLIATMVLFSVTSEHAQDFAVLKALGAPGRLVNLVVVVQALVLVIGGFLVGWGLSSLAGIAIAHLAPVVELSLSLDLVARTLGIFAAANAVALIWPLHFLRRVDPQEVFKA